MFSRFCFLSQFGKYILLVNLFILMRFSNSLTLRYTYYFLIQNLTHMCCPTSHCPHCTFLIFPSFFMTSLTIFIIFSKTFSHLFSDYCLGFCELDGFILTTQPNWWVGCGLGSGMAVCLCFTRPLHSRRLLWASAQDGRKSPRGQALTLNRF